MANGQELKDSLEFWTEDSFGDTDALRLLNRAKNKVEGNGHEWEMLKKRDQSMTWAVSDNFETEHDLPDDFLNAISVTPDTYFQPFLQVPFAEWENFRDLSGYYTIDILNQKLYMMGSTSQPRPLTLFYVRKTADIAIDTSPTWPVAYHHDIIALEAALLYVSGPDADSQNARVKQGLREELKEARSDMAYWDAQIKVRSLENSSSPYKRIGRSPDSLDRDPYCGGGYY